MTGVSSIFRRQSLSRQFVLAVSACVLVSGAIGMIATGHVFRQQLHQALRQESRALTASVESAVEALLDAGAHEQIRRVVADLGSLPDVHSITIVDPAGVAIAHTDHRAVGRPEARQLLEALAARGPRVSVLSEDERTLTEIARLDGAMFGADTPGACVVRFDVDRLQAGVVTSYRDTLAFEIGSLLLASLCIVWLVRRRIIRPIRALQEAATRSENGLGFRVTTSLHSSEFRSLYNVLFDAFHRAEMAFEALRREEQRYFALVSNVPGAVYRRFHDERWTMEFISANVEQITGYPSISYMEEGAEAYAEHVHPADRQRVANELATAVAKRQEYELCYRVRHRDGSDRWVNERGRAVLDDDGRLAALDGAVFDITRQKNHEFELAAAKEGAEAANRELATVNEALEQVAAQANQMAAVAHESSRAKSEFLANMSHEIRTPMTAILGYADILLGAHQSEEERHDAARIIRRNGEHLLAIINDILDLSKIEAEKMEVERIECSPWDLLVEVRDLMSVRAKGKNLALRISAESPLPEVVHSDPTRIRQILTNLAGNAIKFTETGEVQLGVSFDSGLDRGVEPQVVFEVVDSGIGMTPDQLSRLFSPFTQADSSTTRRFGGTGLGLTIAKRLALLLGGDIEVESRVGAGSRFVVRVAANVAPDVECVRPDVVASVSAGTRRATDRRAKAGERIDARILLAEDGPDNQRLISFVLRKAGATVDIAENGEIACAMALTADSGAEPYDLILMDMQMPELDGYGAAQRLRTAGFDRPIVALTAHAMAGDRERCIESGCDDYTTKPIKRGELFSIIRKQLGPLEP